MRKKQFLTMGCVMIAGLIFIPSVLFNMPYIALIGAFFDWLPLPTGWMKSGGKINKTLLLIHIVVTLAAYLFYVVWLFNPHTFIFRFIFLEIWWLAVMAGVFMTIDSFKEK